VNVGDLELPSNEAGKRARQPGPARVGRGRWRACRPLRHCRPERRDLWAFKTESLCKCPDRFGMWVPPQATLQRADRITAQTGALGQLLLREPRGFSQPP
jgi:hypothetical protein